MIAAFRWLRDILLSLQTSIATLFPIISQKLTLQKNMNVDRTWLQNQLSDDIDLNDDIIALVNVISTFENNCSDPNQLFNAVIRYV